MVNQLVDAVQPRLPDEFSKVLLNGALRVLSDGENRIRVNLFASAIRELYTHVLHTLAPDADVRNSPWFNAQREARGRENPRLTPAELDRPTRRQRAIYATQGGISDEQITGLGVDAAEVHSEFLEALDDLSRLTHVRPETIVESSDEVTAFATQALASLINFLDVLDHCRSVISDAILDAVNETAFEELTREAIGDLDVLSTHTYVEGPAIEEIEIVSINASRIHYCVTGEVEVTLNYGSHRDRESGDGASMADSFPFRLTMDAPVSNRDRFENVVCEVDTSSFYE